MTDPSKIQPTHTQRAACVYIRQSTPGQVEHNRESTARQYALADRASQLGRTPRSERVLYSRQGLPSRCRVDRRTDGRSGARASERVTGPD
jgi:hypothetical protein